LGGERHMASGKVERGSAGAKPFPRPRVRLSPVGFWSYSRNDDQFSRGRLSQLRSLLLAELRTQYGRDDIQLFQDVSAIPSGADWERVTSGAIGDSTFFIPIITPFYMQSEWCARETKMFEAREQTIFETYPDLPRDRRRIFPLLWIDITGSEPVDEAAFAAVRAAQWTDFSDIRHRNLENNEDALAKIAAFARDIVDVLQLRVAAPLSAEEKAQLARDAEEAERRAEEERGRQRAEEAEKERLRALERERLAVVEAERLAAQEERDRLANEARKQQEAEQAEAARKWEAERQKAEAEQEAQRRAGRGADIARGAHLLRRPALWLVAGAAVVLFVLALWAMRSSGNRADQNVAAVAENDVAATVADVDAAAAMTANAAAPVAAPGPAIDWLFRRWSIQGNCGRPWTISREGNRIISVSGGQRDVETIQGTSEAEIRTDRNIYRRNGDNVDVVNDTYPYQLRPCP